MARERMTVAERLESLEAEVRDLKARGASAEELEHRNGLLHQQKEFYHQQQTAVGLCHSRANYLAPVSAASVARVGRALIRLLSLGLAACLGAPALAKRVHGKAWVQEARLTEEVIARRFSILGGQAFQDVTRKFWEIGEGQDIADGLFNKYEYMVAYQRIATTLSATPPVQAPCITATDLAYNSPRVEPFRVPAGHVFEAQHGAHARPGGAKLP